MSFTRETFVRDRRGIRLMWRPLLLALSMASRSLRVVQKAFQGCLLMPALLRHRWTRALLCRGLSRVAIARLPRLLKELLVLEAIVAHTRRGHPAARTDGVRMYANFDEERRELQFHATADRPEHGSDPRALALLERLDAALRDKEIVSIVFFHTEVGHHLSVWTCLRGEMRLSLTDNHVMTFDHILQAATPTPAVAAHASLRRVALRELCKSHDGPSAPTEVDEPSRSSNAAAHLTNAGPSAP